MKTTSWTDLEVRNLVSDSKIALSTLHNLEKKHIICGEDLDVPTLKWKWSLCFYLFSKTSGLNKYGLLLELKVLESIGRSERNNSVLIASLNSFMVPSYDQNTENVNDQKSNDDFDVSGIVHVCYHNLSGWRS